MGVNILWDCPSVAADPRECFLSWFSPAQDSAKRLEASREGAWMMGRGPVSCGVEALRASLLFGYSLSPYSGTHDGKCQSGESVP